MNGCVIPGTPIAIDFWKLRECPQVKVFLLTHLHGDHITGLTSSWNHPIYCSEFTKELLIQQHVVKSELIQTLQIGCAEIIFLDDIHQEHMTVTALDANHCPGAVMFLLEGYFGTILHTGDFRFSPDMLTNNVLAKLSGKVDVLYLDNTYCSPRCRFPTREQATTEIINIIMSHPTHDVLIAMRNLGKEELLCKIAKYFHECIYVPYKFYKTLEKLGAPDVFDCENTDLRFRVIPFYTVSKNFVENVNETRPTIVIMPTALYVGIDAKPYENVDNVFIVPYSDHSSYSELREFVFFLRPGKIIPIVKGTSRGPFGMSIADRADMSCFSKLTGEKWNESVEVPLSVQAYMENGNFRAAIVKQMPSRKRPKQSSSKYHMASKKIRGINYESLNEKKGEIPSEDCSGKQNREAQNSQDDLVTEPAEPEMSIPGNSASTLDKQKEIASDLNTAVNNLSNSRSRTTTMQPKTALTDCLMESSQGFEVLNESTGFDSDEVITPNKQLKRTRHNTKTKELIQDTQREKCMKLSKAALAVYQENMEKADICKEASKPKALSDVGKKKTDAKKTKRNEEIIQWIVDTESQMENSGIDAKVQNSQSEVPSTELVQHEKGDTQRNVIVINSDHSDSVLNETNADTGALKPRALIEKYIGNRGLNREMSPKQNSTKKNDISKYFPKHASKCNNNKNTNNSEKIETEESVSVTPVTGGKRPKLTKCSSKQNLITKCIGSESNVIDLKRATKGIEHLVNIEKETQSTAVVILNISQSIAQEKTTVQKPKDLSRGKEAESEEVLVDTHTEASQHKTSETDHHFNSNDIHHEIGNEMEQSKETCTEVDANSSRNEKGYNTKSHCTITETKSIDNEKRVKLKNNEKSVRSKGSLNIEKVDSVTKFNQKSDVQISHCRRCEVQSIINAFQGKGPASACSHT